MEKTNEASRAHLFRIKLHPQPQWVKLLPVVGRILQCLPPTPISMPQSRTLWIGDCSCDMFYDLKIGRLAQWAGSSHMNLKTGGRQRDLKQEGSMAITCLNMERSTREGIRPALRSWERPRQKRNTANPLNEHGSSFPRAPVGECCPAGPWFQPVTPWAENPAIPRQIVSYRTGS